MELPIKGIVMVEQTTKILHQATGHAFPAAQLRLLSFVSKRGARPLPNLILSLVRQAVLTEQCEDWSQGLRNNTHVG